MRSNGLMAFAIYIVTDIVVARIHIFGSWVMGLHGVADKGIKRLGEYSIIALADYQSRG